MAVAATELNVVTGAFSFSGSFIAERLLAEGKAVRTLTGHPGREHRLRDWGDSVAHVELDGANTGRILTGYRPTLSGADLIVWLEGDMVQPAVVHVTCS